MSMRLDQAAIDHYKTRTKAQDAIKDGRVFVNGKKITKCAYQVEDTDRITYQEIHQYVSRAAYKLLAAIHHFHIDLKNQCVLDIGASTGGFSQVCLEQGARKVYALDVGHLQLDPSLEEDSRLIKKEGCNAREIQLSDFEESIDFICMDVSFISSKTILDHVLSLPWPHLETMVILIKPQFECGPAALNKKGVLKNKKLREKIIQDSIQYLKQYFITVKPIDSPIEGRSGNLEALLYAKGKR